ncbi:hypothetical protein ISN45_Aa03g003860 [Arabidopsis thaliana x Arabidopsis arenosa]|uniref:Uncharacterized protein n=1 Tax=Arabidopsis thaliana x Arabidopsis arenosa TaxID=1240361 RepID=A0A8T2API9_9BRAS|nr:hypothetical protein ISN45_Aa03g003860 [Arabidopsis thaliana x Arabidopsis arenosa]
MLKRELLLGLPFKLLVTCLDLLRDIQMQEVKKQQSLSHSPNTKTSGFTVATGQGFPSDSPRTNRWFKPEIDAPSPIRSIQIEEKAMKDLRRFYSSVKGSVRTKNLTVKMKLFDAHCHLQDKRVIDEASQLISAAFSCRCYQFRSQWNLRERLGLGERDGRDVSFCCSLHWTTSLNLLIPLYLAMKLQEMINCHSI